MSKYNKDVYSLFDDWVEIEASCQCTKCHKGTYCNEHEPGKELYGEGWRATENHCYCPDCAKKFLRRKKKKKL